MLRASATFNLNFPHAVRETLKNRHAHASGYPEPAKHLGSRLRGSDDKWLFQRVARLQSGK
jgi:hypothetical protein